MHVFLERLISSTLFWWLECLNKNQPMEGTAIKAEFVNKKQTFILFSLNL